MRALVLPCIELRRHEAHLELPVPKKRYEIVLHSDSSSNFVRHAVKMARTPGVVEVAATTESGRGSIWRVLTSRAGIDLSWAGNSAPHSKQVVGTAKFKGSYAKTSKGTWRVAMSLVPVVDEGLERERLIAHRGAAGVSLRIKDDRMTFGFVLEVAAPREGTLIAQSALLNTAAKVGVRCEILADPHFAAIVDGLLAFTDGSR